MKQYWLRLFPEQPLSLEDERIIPAAALRGAIAANLLGGCVKGHEHDTGPCSADCRYWSLFGEGANVRIGPAYAGSGDQTEPLLATVRTCGKAPGFKTAGGHGVFDVAIRQWVFERVCAEPQRLFAPFSLRCPTCEAALEPYEEMVTRQGEREFAVVKDVATPVQITYAALNRTRKRVVGRYPAAGKLVNRGLYYVAKVDTPERLDSLLREAMADGLRIGGRRSRGMGAVGAELAERQTDQPGLAERISRFNRAIRAEQRFYAATGTASLARDEGEWYFTLDARSPLLGAYESGPSIIPVLSTLPSVIPIRQWLATEPVGGWHAAEGLPRRTQLGATGVILYRVPSETKHADVEELLAFAETAGLGAGRELGHGAITICDPFHLFMDPL